MTISKLIKLFPFYLFLVSGCTTFDDNNAKVLPYNMPEITNQQLNLVPYQINDQIIFKNASGTILNYTCVNRNHYRDPFDPNIRCGANVDHCYEFLYDHLDVQLRCLNDTTNNIKIHYKGGLDLEFSFPNFNSYKYVIYTQPDPAFSCGLTNSSFYYPSIKTICLDSLVIGNYKYYNVSKITADPTTSNGISYPDTLYYNQDKGVLKFCLNNVIWIKQ